jgi:hypothetical protein
MGILAELQDAVLSISGFVGLGFRGHRVHHAGWQQTILGPLTMMHGIAAPSSSRAPVQLRLGRGRLSKDTLPIDQLRKIWAACVSGTQMVMEQEYHQLMLLETFRLSDTRT